MLLIENGDRLAEAPIPVQMLSRARRLEQTCVYLQLSVRAIATVVHLVPHGHTVEQACLGELKLGLASDGLSLGRRGLILGVIELECEYLLRLAQRH